LIVGKSEKKYFSFGQELFLGFPLRIQKGFKYSFYKQFCIGIKIKELKMVFLGLITWLSVFFNGAVFSKNENHDVILKFSKLKTKKGKILISIFKSARGFPQDEKSAFKSFVEDPKEEIVLKNIPPGKYAIALLHDEDGNFKMTYNILHLPKEGFAFSNYKSSLLNIPDFDDAMFEHQSKTTNLEITIVY